MSADERVRSLMAAASSAAASTVTAIERIQLMAPVVEAARVWRAAADGYPRWEAEAELNDVVLVYERAIANRS